MANQQATLHNIPLASQNLNTTRYKLDISPYEGYVEENSPFYGNVLSTFYVKEVDAPAQSTFITTNGDVYFINQADGCLYKQENGQNVKLLHSANFIVKDLNDTVLPNTESPEFSSIAQVKLKTGAVNQNINVTKNVWYSENGSSYTSKSITTEAYNNVISSGNSSQLTVDGKSYYGVPLSENNAYVGGLAAELINGLSPGAIHLRALFNNQTLQGYSVALDDQTIGTLLCGLGTVDIDKGVSYTNNSIKFFLADGTFCSIKFTKTTSDAKMSIANNRYIILNYAEYYNCWDTLLDKPFHFASDFNSRAITYATSGTGSNATTLTTYGAGCVAYVQGNGIWTNFSIATVPFVSTQFATALEYQLDSLKTGVYVQKGYSPDNQWIEVFRGKLRDSTYPPYVCSYNNVNEQVVDTSLADTRYTNTFYGIPSIFSEFTKSYLNKSIIQDWDYSYLQTYVNGTKYIFAYSAEDELEHVQSAFVIQGQDFVVINNIIYRYYSESGQLQACVNIDNMNFVGNTPYNAIFWSNTNKTFYTFTGDNLLNTLLQANEIEAFHDSGYNPNTMAVYAVLDKGLYIFTQEQLIKIPGQFSNVFPLATGLALVSESKIIYYSYNALEGCTKQPIKLQTMFYGQGNNVVSVNDCVYIRLYNDGTNNEGKVVLQCSTLKQEALTTESKTFNITEDMWDPNSNTLFLRYQPKYQEATGFSVRIESDFAISELKISEIPVTIQNSKYNI